jgi:methionyl-tRNA formyltransferase
VTARHEGRRPLRVAFLGNAPWSVPSLEALAGAGHDVALVATRAPKPAGRGGTPSPTPVAEAARGLGLPLAEVATVREGAGFDAIAAAAPEVVAVVAYGEILPPPVLALASIAPVNVHFSLLPRLRGAAPVQRAILNGVHETGVTTIRMDEGMDTGPILLQSSVPIDPADDTGSLGARLAFAGAGLLVQTLDRLGDGILTERPQDRSLATLAPKLSRDDEWIDWRQPREATLRRIRALSPSPGAATRFRGRRLKVFRASAGGTVAPGPAAAPAKRRPAGEPGTIVPGAASGPPAAIAADGPVLLDEVQPEGRRRMSGEEFERGYRPKPGEHLG